MSSPDEYPFGQTEYLNYDPEQINTLEDAVEFLNWLAEVNREMGNMGEGASYKDAANMLEKCLDGELTIPEDSSDTGE